MAHQCIHCGQLYPDASKELLEGCSKCGSHFFYYLKKMPESKAEMPQELSLMDKKKVEKDVREIMGVEDEEVPVILDLESIRIAGPGKFEIDVVNIFDKKRPLIYKLDEGKYIIDLASTLKVSHEEIHKKIRRPEKRPKIEVQAQIKEGEKVREYPSPSTHKRDNDEPISGIQEEASGNQA